MDSIIIKEKLVGMIKRVKPSVDMLTIIETTDLISDLDFESFDIIKLVVEIEQTFEVVFPDNVMQQDFIRKYGNIYQWLTNQIISG